MMKEFTLEETGTETGVTMKPIEQEDKHFNENAVIATKNVSKLNVNTFRKLYSFLQKQIIQKEQNHSLVQMLNY